MQLPFQDGPERVPANSVRTRYAPIWTAMTAKDFTAKALRRAVGFHIASVLPTVALRTELRDRMWNKRYRNHLETPCLVCYTERAYGHSSAVIFLKKQFREETTRSNVGRYSKVNHVNALNFKGRQNSFFNDGRFFVLTTTDVCRVFD